jgi:hypothetical protein
LKKIIYLTFNDAPSGIFSGQVIDVCKYWKELGFDVKLISFISLRNFKENKNTITNSFSDAIVLPMFPKARNWRLNSWFLGKKIRKVNPSIIVCRGVFAANLAMQFRIGRKICFDARGAYAAEFSEYDVLPDIKVKSEVENLECISILESDFRMAISEQLVNYWKIKYAYNSDKHVVVPCTLNRSTLVSVSDFDRMSIRNRLGFSKQSKVIVYSGSSAGWQSLKNISDALLPVFKSDLEVNLLLLTTEIGTDMPIFKMFPQRVKFLWLSTHEVGAYLSACDYGWLVRENTDTNRVASPVKFAEYLAAGLEVIISNELGDYSNYVLVNNVGLIWNNDNPIKFLPKPNIEQKNRIIKLCKKSFMKETYHKQYFKLLE